MAKIVLNNDYGGFGLSQEAADRLAEMLTADGELTGWDGDPDSLDVRRDDPRLVSVVEELGDRANGPDASLVVAEYDEQHFNCTIDDRDGMESLSLDPVIDTDELTRLVSGGDADGLSEYLDMLGISHTGGGPADDVETKANSYEDGLAAWFSAHDVPDISGFDDDQLNEIRLALEHGVPDEGVEVMCNGRYMEDRPDLNEYEQDRSMHEMRLAFEELSGMISDGSVTVEDIADTVGSPDLYATEREVPDDLIGIISQEYGNQRREIIEILKLGVPPEEVRHLCNGSISAEDLGSLQMDLETSRDPAAVAERIDMEAVERISGMPQTSQETMGLVMEALVEGNISPDRIAEILSAFGEDRISYGQLGSILNAEASPDMTKEMVDILIDARLNGDGYEYIGVFNNDGDVDENLAEASSIYSKGNTGNQMYVLSCRMEHGADLGMMRELAGSGVDARLMADLSGMERQAPLSYSCRVDLGAGSPTAMLCMRPDGDGFRVTAEINDDGRCLKIETTRETFTDAARALCGTYEGFMSEDRDWSETWRPQSSYLSKWDNDSSMFQGFEPRDMYKVIELCRSGRYDGDKVAVTEISEKEYDKDCADAGVPFRVPMDDPRVIEAVAQAEAGLDARGEGTYRISENEGLLIDECKGGRYSVTHLYTDTASAWREEYRTRGEAVSCFKAEVRYSLGEEDAAIEEKDDMPDAADDDGWDSADVG